MTSVWLTILEELRSAIAAAVPAAARATFEVPPNPAMGDIAVPCFTLARSLKRPPPTIAARIAETLSGHPLVASATVAGPYVNIVIESTELARRVLTAPTPSRSPSRREGEKVVLEFVSPNANKPLHLGHLRNAFLGEAIARCLEAQGHEVHRVCLVNDRGIHIMKSLLAYQRWGAGSTPESEGVKGDHFVGNWYVRFEEESKKQRNAPPPHAPPPGGRGGNQIEFLPLTLGGGARGGGEGETPLEQEAAELLRKWEAGDAEVRALWQRMTDWVLAGFRESYATIGVVFEREYRESDIYEDGRRIVADALGRGVFQKDAKGNTIAPLKDRFGLDDKVVERTDGTTVYATQDLALATAKARDLHPDRSVIITGNEQDYYFRQLFAIFELLGMPGADRNAHRSYGMVELPEGKMKSREGTVVDADDLIAELTRLAEEEIRKRADIVPGEPDAGTDEPPIIVPALRSSAIVPSEGGSDAALARAKDIALAAIRFYLLLVTPETTVTFDPKASLAFTGKTGPYVQYMHARLCSIFRKAAQLQAASYKPQATDSNGLQLGAGSWELLAQPAEKQLLLRLARFSDVVATAADQLDPSGLAQYVYDLAKAFADFYRDVPVLKADTVGLRDARLALCDAVRMMLARGLMLLGIAPLSEM